MSRDGSIICFWTMFPTWRGLAGWKLYVLRAYFDTQSMFAESKGLVLQDYR